MNISGIGDQLMKLFSLFTKDMNPVFDLIDINPNVDKITLGLSTLSNEVITKLKEYEETILRGYVSIEAKQLGLFVTNAGAITGGNVDLTISTRILKENRYLFQ